MDRTPPSHRVFSPIDRRTALKRLSATALALPLARSAAAADWQPEPAAKPASPATPGGAQPFLISLAEWSLHRALSGKKIEHLDFPRLARTEYGIDAVEYVNTFWKERTPKYTGELATRCRDVGVTSVLIMCDGEGALGDPDAKKRATAVENHRKWLDAAKTLGCHSIRVNAQSKGEFEEQQKLAADGLRKLCEIADPYNLNVIVENHWGLSSNGKWLSGVMKLVNNKRIGTLPDFGNFDPKEYDRYQGVADMMPFARGVSAKSHDFDDATGEETGIDYRRMLKIVLDAGYHGRLGIEYEGERLSEPDGIRATKKLLEKIRSEVVAAQHPATKP